MNKLNGNITKILSGLFAVALLFFIGKNIIANWSELSDYQLSLRPVQLLGSFLLFSISVLFSAMAFQIMLRGGGVVLPFKRVLAISTFSQVGKYLPGNVWPYLVRFRYLKQDISSGAFISIAILENVVMVFAAITLGAISLIELSDSPFIIPTVTIITLALILIIVKPAWFYGVINFGSRYIKFLKVESEQRLNQSVLAKSYILLLISWITKGAGFYFLVSSILEIPAGQLIFFISAFASAVIAGYIVIIVPSGLGVREGVMVLLLQTIFPLNIASLIAIVARLWVVASDVVLSLPAFFYLNKTQNNENQPS